MTVQSQFIQIGFIALSSCTVHLFLFSNPIVFFARRVPIFSLRPFPLIFRLFVLSLRLPPMSLRLDGEAFNFTSPTGWFEMTKRVYAIPEKATQMKLSPEVCI